MPQVCALSMVKVPSHIAWLNFSHYFSKNRYYQSICDMNSGNIKISFWKSKYFDGSNVIAIYPWVRGQQRNNDWSNLFSVWYCFILYVCVFICRVGWIYSALWCHRLCVRYIPITARHIRFIQYLCMPIEKWRTFDVKWIVLTKFYQAIFHHTSQLFK